MNSEVNCLSIEAFERTDQRGMGGMPPMKRSGTDVELVAVLADYRGRFVSDVLAAASRHAKQASVES